MRALFAVTGAVLWVTDGIHELRKSYHPLQDWRTYLESRKAHVQ